MGSCDVHGDGVVVCRCSLDRCQLAELAEETIDPFLDLFIGRCWRRNFDGDAVVARDVHGRTNDNNCVEDQVSLFDPRGDVVLGRADHVYFLVANGGQEIVRDAVFERLAPGHATPEAGLEHLAGHLALPEAGQVDIAPDLLKGLCDLNFEFCGFNFDRQLHFVVVEFLNGGLHRSECRGRPDHSLRSQSCFLATASRSRHYLTSRVCGNFASFAKEDLSWAALPVSSETSSGCSSMARTSAFQADDEGSTPFTRSIRTSQVVGRDCLLVRAQYLRV